MNQDQIEFNKTLGQKQKEASVKGCLRGGDEQAGCAGKIVQAHSIQRGKILASIADGGSGKVYYLGLAPADDMTSMIPEFKLEGIKKFSTFSGFCGWHDKSIFQPIEDVVFTATAKQKDIYAYRAAAKELHANLESKRLCEIQLGDKLGVEDFPPHLQAMLPLILQGLVEVPPFIKKAMLEGAAKQQIKIRHKQCEHNIAELRQICDDLTGAIDHDHPSEFEHVYHSLEGACPVACCTSYIPYFDHDGNRIISEQDERRMALSRATRCLEMKNVMLNVFPEAGRTHFIFTFSKGNQTFKDAIERLLKLDNGSLRIGLSNILLNYAENSAYGPNYIEENFSPEQITALKEAFSSTVFDPSAFRKGSINLFVEAISVPPSNR
ncbi:hypothetical protein BLL42_24890 [Pseudomonas frederiksbergensis]|uniref:Uncharacterized protein n=1 Tax=Pseudomonas frederiksbergensis TaxID=104087 RepID=A0A1J0ESA4_9PSED|nr:hypothetical protein [Pseudomonas frederiksbergensis]APC18783.1 hypothetical protein BLL42_24890 [Pseudomonas frederiksbergensis]